MQFSEFEYHFARNMISFVLAQFNPEGCFPLPSHRCVWVLWYTFCSYLCRHAHIRVVGKFAKKINCPRALASNLLLSLRMPLVPARIHESHWLEYQHTLILLNILCIAMSIKSWAAPRILRWRVQNRIRERSEREIFFVPLLFQMWGVQASKYQ